MKLLQAVTLIQRCLRGRWGRKRAAKRREEYYAEKAQNSHDHAIIATLPETRNEKSKKRSEPKGW